MREIPVNELYFTYEDGTKIEDDKPLKFELKGSNNQYQLHWEVGPDDAANKKVKFTSSREEIAEVDEDGVVTFYARYGDVTITVESLDGSNISDSIQIVLQVKSSDVDIK